MVQKKILIPAGIVLGIVIIFILFLVLRKDNSSDMVPLLKAVPENAAFVIQISDIVKLSNELADNQAFGQWKNIEEYDTLIYHFQRIVQTLKNNDEAAEMIQNAVMLISFVYIDDLKDVSFILGFSENNSFKKIAGIFQSLKKELEIDVINERKGQHRIELVRFEKDTVHVGYINNVMVFSHSIQSVEQSIGQLQTEETQPWESFSSHTSSDDMLFSLFCRNGSLKEYLNRYFLENSMFPMELIPDSGSIDVVLTEKNQDEISLVFNGTFSRMFVEQGHYSADYSIWFHALQGKALAVTGYVDEFEIHEKISGLFSDNYIEFVFRPLETETSPVSLLVFHITDTAAFIQNLQYFSRPLSEAQVKNHSFSNCDTVGVLREATMITHNPFMYSILRENTYFALIRQYLIVSPYLGTIERSVDDFVEYNKQENLQSQNFHSSMYLDFASYYPYLLVSTGSEYESFFSEMYAVLASYRHLQFNLISKGSISKFEVILRIDPKGQFSFLEENADFFLGRMLRRNLEIEESLLVLPNEAKMNEDSPMLNVYYPDSVLHYTGHFSDGKPDGTWRFYYPNASMQATIEYKNGKADGRAVFYRSNPDGKMLVTCTYRGNTLHGQYIEFHKNGKPALSVNFVNGVMKGNLRLYYATGTIMAETVVDNNERIQDYSLYTITGDFIEPDNFSASGFILNNYIAFIAAQNSMLGK